MTHVSQHLLGEFAIAGDWACRHGEFDALADLARELAARVPEPLHCELATFAESCAGDPRLATTTWPHLRERVFEAADTTGRFT